MKKTQKLWSAAEEQRIVELRNQGLTFSEIGDLMGRTAISVRTRFYIVTVENRKPKHEGIDPALICEGWKHPAIVAMRANPAILSESTI